MGNRKCRALVGRSSVSISEAVQNALSQYKNHGDYVLVDSHCIQHHGKKPNYEVTLISYPKA